VVNEVRIVEMVAWLFVFRRTLGLAPSLTTYMASTPKGNEMFYQQLRDFLSSEPTVAEKIKVEPKEDRQVTGNFEVTIGRDVLHSKRKGMGRTETQEERDAILEKIRELLIADE
jgi:hypothetical protein